MDEGAKLALAVASNWGEDKRQEEGLAKVTFRTARWFRGVWL